MNKNNIPQFTPNRYKSHLSPFGRNVLDTLIMQWRTGEYFLWDLLFWAIVDCIYIINLNKNVCILIAQFNNTGNRGRQQLEESKRNEM